jgi:Holliday junction resolvasome RuvABC endonuclease subunit
MKTQVFDGGLMDGSSIAIGIDQSLTGFAVAAVSTSDPSQYEIHVFSSKLTGVRRLSELTGKLIQLIESYEDDHGCRIVDTAMEGTVLMSPSALKLGELAGAVKIALYEFFHFTEPTRLVHSPFPLQVPPSTLKKYVTGKGNAKKQEMLLSVYKRWGVDLSDDNAADAYGLALIAGKHFKTQSDKDVLDKIHNGDYRDK